MGGVDVKNAVLDDRFRSEDCREGDRLDGELPIWSGMSRGRSATDRAGIAGMRTDNGSWGGLESTAGPRKLLVPRRTEAAAEEGVGRSTSTEPPRVNLATHGCRHAASTDKRALRRKRKKQAGTHKHVKEHTCCLKDW
jgi:hypothetical protein